jgi:GTP cyclohydrolase II
VGQGFVSAGCVDPGAEEAKVRTRIEVPLEIASGVCMSAELISFTGLLDATEHLAVLIDGPELRSIPLVRIHSECLTGDVFGSCRCDCGPQLRDSLKIMAGAGGVILYLRQEGRGIGLYRKLEAYALQDLGLDTFEANRHLNLPEDARSYVAAAQMLHALHFPRIRLLSNNPDKVRDLEQHGIEVLSRVATGVFANPRNRAYLRAKIVRRGHSIPIRKVDGK